VASFVNRVTLVLAGERVEIRTNAGDQLNAERGIGAGKSPLELPVELGMRVWFSALRRQHPEHPAAKNFRAFVEDLEEGTEEEPDDEAAGLDPTRPADSDD
jgi:hypothetical protein